MSLSLDLRRFADKGKGNMVQVAQKVSIDLISVVIDRSPVGNPELWAANATATEYNLEVLRFNSELRSDPNNLTKAGHLRKGLKVNDSMDLASGDGYVGGRFRGNWQVSFETRAIGTLARIDPQGATTKGEAIGVVMGFTSAVGTIWAINNLPYAQRLEQGWSTQAPNGMVRLSVTEFQMFVNRAVSELP